MLLCSAFLGALATQQDRQIPDSLRKASQDPDLVKWRNLYLKVHIPTRPFPVTFKHREANPTNVKGEKADLRPAITGYGIGVKQQGNRGTCSVFALNFLHEFTTCRRTGRKNVNFSEEYLNFIGNVAVGQFVDGGFFTDLNNGYQSFGHVPQRDLPYSDPMNSDVNTKGYTLLKTGERAPKYKADFIKPWDNTRGPTTAEMNKACDELDAGVPVAAGFLWPNDSSFKQKEIGGVDMMVKIPRSDVFDGHSIDLVGYEKGSQFPGGGYFIFRNSWGADWGDQGYGFMAFDYAKAYANDMICYP